MTTHASASATRPGRRNIFIQMSYTSTIAAECASGKPEREILPYHRRATFIPAVVKKERAYFLRTQCVRKYGASDAASTRLPPQG